MTITSSAPPSPASAVPASVTGQAGPKQNMAMPEVRPMAATNSEVRRPSAIDHPHAPDTRLLARRIRTSSHAARQ